MFIEGAHSLSYIIVHVQFPGVAVEQENEIFKDLESRGWEKIHTIDLDSSTIWQKYLDNVNESNLIETAKKDFNDCSKSASPRLLIHAGSSPEKVIELLKKQKIDKINKAQQLEP